MSNENNGGNGGFNLNNIDWSQLAGLLNNIDVGQLTSMLGSFNLGGGPAADDGNEKPHNTFHGGDKRVEVLSAIKPLVTAERAELIDIIIQVYLISKILKR